MADEMQLKMVLDYLDRGARRGLTQLEQTANRTFNNSTQYAGKFTRSMVGLGKQTGQVLSDLNGFSAASKLLAAAGGIQIFRGALNKNLNFERDLIEIKQMAGMTMQQANELRAIAMNSAQDTLQTPDEMLQGIKAFARAGTKFDEIKAKIIEAGKAATVFRATTEEIANMDFDMTDKLKIDAAKMPAVHNMLYYHGNSGRFEGSQLAKQAPTLFNAVGAVGIGGERGLNFTGALTQVLMKSASVSEPGMVSTLMQQGLGHITSPRYVKGLQKAGIDVQKYAPGGKFYGAGGVDGLLDLADAMKAKGLQDPFKLGKAGFADQETIKFFRGLMQYSDSIRAEMKNADKAASKNQIAVDLAEMKQANFGKIKAAEIEVEKMKLSEPAQKTTSWAGDLAKHFSENAGGYVKAALGVVATGLALRYRRNAQARVATSEPAPIKKPYSLSTSLTESPAKNAGLKNFVHGAKSVAKGGGLISAGVGLVEVGNIALDDKLNQQDKNRAYKSAAGGTTGALAGTAIGGGVGALFGGVGAVPGAMLGGMLGDLIGRAIAEHLANTQIVVNSTNTMNVDGKQLAQATEKHYGRFASRN